jgi:hypothetical protein
VQWIEIVRDTVRASRERGDTDPKAFAGTLRSALGERSLPPELTRILARADDGKYKAITSMWRSLDEACAVRSGNSALWSVIGVAVATLFGFLVAYGC